MSEIIVNVEVAARKLLRDPKGLAAVGVVELRALAEYALLDLPILRASLAAAITKVLMAHDQLPDSLGGWMNMPTEMSELDRALIALHEQFEEEFSHAQS